MLISYVGKKSPINYLNRPLHGKLPNAIYMEMQFFAPYSGILGHYANRLPTYF